MSIKVFDAEYIERNYCWRSELRLNLVIMPKRLHRLIGSYTAIPYDLIVELVSLARRRIVKPHISNRFKLSEATPDAYMPKHGKTVVMGVVNP